MSPEGAATLAVVEPLLRVRSTRVNDSGASAVEYALLVVGIAAVIVAIVFTLGRLTQANYRNACSSWASAVGDSAC